MRLIQILAVVKRDQTGGYSDICDEIRGEVGIADGMRGSSRECPIGMPTVGGKHCALCPLNYDGVDTIRLMGEP